MGANLRKILPRNRHSWGLFGFFFLKLPLEGVVFMPSFDLNKQINFQPGYTTWLNK